MNNFYEIIGDEKELDKFLDWLPDTSDNNQLYWTLFARKKYSPNNLALSYDKTLLKRGTATKDRLKAKLKQLECRIGGYVGKDNLPIPQESLALYITPTPRDMRRATLSSIKRFADLLDNDNTFNLHQEVLNVIQTTPDKKNKFHIFDIDSKEQNVLDNALEIVENNCSIIETRGGFHLLIAEDDVKSIQKKNWYPLLKHISDVVGDCLSPMPGCWQGGYIPKLIK